jgi:RimJ/RimL family protein N-acetyltransferase
MTPPVFLRGETVTLRPVEEQDAEFLQTNINDPEVWRALKRRQPISDHEEREWIQSLGDEDGANFVVYADDEPVGNIGLHEVNDQWGTAEVGFWVAPDEQGNGYGREACELVVGYGFDQLRLAKITAEAYAFNDASQGLLESVGFTHEATLRDHAFVNGERVDLLVYGLLAEEWDG